MRIIMLLVLVGSLSGCSAVSMVGGMESAARVDAFYTVCKDPNQHDMFPEYLDALDVKYGFPQKSKEEILATYQSGEGAHIESVKEEVTQKVISMGVCSSPDVLAYKHGLLSDYYKGLVKLAK